jgi:hypothetical protein
LAVEVVLVVLAVTPEPDAPLAALGADTVVLAATVENKLVL